MPALKYFSSALPVLVYHNHVHVGLVLAEKHFKSRPVDFLAGQSFVVNG